MNADIAMDHAKRSGGNQYRFHTMEMNAAFQRHVELEAYLRKALERGEFTLLYQPQVELDGERLIGVEALIRWNCAELGLISPAQFIPVAEQTGLIRSIGHWVLEEACREAKRWEACGGGHVEISVNVSAGQFMQPDFVSRVRSILSSTGLAPQRLCLEITESMVVHNLQATLTMLQELAGLGIRIAMDDFGTGYSSLSVIKQLPISTIKIDRSFMGDLTKEDADRSIVPAIISMSTTLGKKVVAEGVETSEQLQLLKRMGCDTAQGYYFSRPLTASALIRYFQYGIEKLDTRTLREDASSLPSQHRYAQ
ncbi:EAL domain-containing protein [Paenibacillus sp. CC-CFT747]|nr:EAL domain-containing protein [Paenibacillus sp. CC-CFT747]